MRPAAERGVMTMGARLIYLLSKAGYRIMPFRQSGEGQTPLPAFLAQMDDYDWAAADDVEFGRGTRFAALTPVGLNEESHGSEASVSSK